jgi:hypothetical protein
LYQGRYNCFLVETENYFYQVVLLRAQCVASLVARAENWPWLSLRRAERDAPAFPILSDWPLPRPVDWLETVNQPQTDAELNALHRSARRGRPLGSAVRTTETAKQIKLGSTLRRRGRPRKE